MSERPRHIDTAGRGEISTEQVNSEKEKAELKETPLLLVVNQEPAVIIEDEVLAQQVRETTLFQAQQKIEVIKYMRWQDHRAVVPTLS